MADLDGGSPVSETQQLVKKAQEIVDSNLERIEKLTEDLARIKKVTAEW